MPAERFFTTALLPTSKEIAIGGDEYHHVIRVMRMREGETAEFVNGMGTLAVAKLQTIAKNEALFSVETLTTAPVPKRQLVLVQAMPKMDRLEFIAEKGTELGMTALWVFPGDHSEKEGLSTNQKARLNAILIASMKQCGSLYLPVLETKPKLSAWKEFPRGGFYGDVRSEAPTFAEALNKVNKSDDIYFFVGPEAGFSEKEVGCLERGGVYGVHLHKNILRTDTAGIVALVISNS